MHPYVMDCLTHDWDTPIISAAHAALGKIISTEPSLRNIATC
jgi:hypothetical protein